MALAALTAYQAVLLTPILAVYVWLFHRRTRARWLILLVPPLTVGAWQLFERLSTGALPAGRAQRLSGHSPDLRRQAGERPGVDHPLLVHRLPRARAGRHSCSPGAGGANRTRCSCWRGSRFSSPAPLLVILRRLGAYLLPMAAPVALLASRLRPKWLAAGFALQLALGLGLAAVNYQHWDGYRQFAESLRGRRGGPSRLGRRRMGPALLPGIRRRLAAEEDPAPAPRRHRGFERTGRFRQPRRPVRSAPHGGDPARHPAAADRPGIALGVLHGIEGFLALRSFRRA